MVLGVVGRKHEYEGRLAQKGGMFLFVASGSTLAHLSDFGPSIVKVFPDPV